MTSVSMLFDEIGDGMGIRSAYNDLFDKHGERDELRFTCVHVKYPEVGLGEKYIFGEMLVFGNTLFNEHNKVHAIIYRTIDLTNYVMV